MYIRTQRALAVGVSEKSISAKKWSDILAKVPECQKRTQCTYNTFVEILKVV